MSWAAGLLPEAVPVPPGRAPVLHTASHLACLCFRHQKNVDSIPFVALAEQTVAVLAAAQAAGPAASVSHTVVRFATAAVAARRSQTDFDSRPMLVARAVSKAAPAVVYHIGQHLRLASVAAAISEEAEELEAAVLELGLSVCWAIPSGVSAAVLLLVETMDPAM